MCVLWQSKRTLLNSAEMASRADLVSIVGQFSLHFRLRLLDASANLMFVMCSETFVRELQSYATADVCELWQGHDRYTT